MNESRSAVAGTEVAASAPSLAGRIAAYRAGVYDAGRIVGDTGVSHDLWPIALTRPAGDFLRDLVVRERAARTLEVGLGLGMSSLAIVEGLATVTPNPVPGSHVTIDPEPQWCDGAGVRALRESGAMDAARFLRQPSELALPALLSAGERFDFAFIDGAHLFDHALVDMFFALRLVRTGGLVVLDDHWMASVQTALAFAVTNWGVELELFDAEGPGKRLVAFRSSCGHAKRAWDQFTPFSRADLPAYPWRA